MRQILRIPTFQLPFLHQRREMLFRQLRRISPPQRSRQITRRPPSQLAERHDHAVQRRSRRPPPQRGNLRLQPPRNIREPAFSIVPTGIAVPPFLFAREPPFLSGNPLFVARAPLFSPGGPPNLAFADLHTIFPERHLCDRARRAHRPPTPTSSRSRARATASANLISPPWSV